MTDKKGKKMDMTVRVTDGYKKVNGQWLISHEHVSVPVNFSNHETRPQREVRPARTPGLRGFSTGDLGSALQIARPHVSREDANLAQRNNEPTIRSSLSAWPALPAGAWSGTCATLQLWMQIVGKIRLALMPPINHCWGVTLYPTVRGVTTSPMPYGNRTLQIDFDFVDHVLVVEAFRGGAQNDSTQADDGGGVLPAGDGRA